MRTVRQEWRDGVENVPDVLDEAEFMERCQALAQELSSACIIDLLVRQLAGFEQSLPDNLARLGFLDNEQAFLPALLEGSDIIFGADCSCERITRHTSRFCEVDQGPTEVKRDLLASKQPHTLLKCADRTTRKLLVERQGPKFEQGTGDPAGIVRGAGEIKRLGEDRLAPRIVALTSGGDAKRA